MSEKIKVRMPPEKVDDLKTKYGVSADALKEIMASLELSETPEATIISGAKIPGETQFMRQLMHGEVGIGEALILTDIFDRKERRERERNQPPAPQVKAEDVGKAVATQVASALKEAGVTGKPAAGKEELPSWAKDIREQQDEILTRMKKGEEEKRLGEAIDKQVTPLKHELEKAQEEIKELSSKPGAPPGEKSRLEIFLDTRKDLKEAGILKEPESGALMMLDEDGKPIQGLPVSGKIPAALVYGPYVVDQIMTSIEKRIDKIAERYGLGEAKAGPPKAREPLIKMPPKPTPKPAAAPPPTEEPAAPPTPPRPVLKLPPKPREEAAVARLKEKPCAACGKVVPLLPSGLCEPCAKELAGEREEEAVEKSAPKKYFCVCGAGFVSGLDKARHTKTCPEAKEARAKEEAKKLGREKPKPTSK